MAKEETGIVHDIMLAASKKGNRLFKNVRGMFYTLDILKTIIAIVKSEGLAGLLEANRKGRLRRVAAGLLCPGASDGIGWTSVKITEEMVGRTVAVFTAVEVKTALGQPTDEQLHFNKIVRESGGFAGVARSVEDYEKIITFPA